MSFCTAFLISLSLFSCLSTSIDLHPDLFLVGVVEVIRHGARTPLIHEHTSNFYYGTMPSQLTINGFRQHILLGRWIRRRYVIGETYPLIKKNFEEMEFEEVKVISSNFQRAIFSASAHVLGLFPKSIIKLNFQGNNEIKNDDVPPLKDYEVDIRDGKEIAINVINSNEDRLLKAEYCKLPGQKSTIKEFLSVQEQEIFEFKFSEIEKAIEEVTKHYPFIVRKTIAKNYKRILNKIRYNQDNKFKMKYKYNKKLLNKIISCLRPFRYHLDFKLKLSKETLKIIDKFTLNKVYRWRVFESQEMKLFSSNLFDKILNFFKKRIENKTLYKMLIFSGFDRTIVDIFANLFHLGDLKKKVKRAVNSPADYHFLIPPLASSLIFELIRSKTRGDYFIRMIYNGKEIKDRLKIKVKYNEKYNLYEFNDFAKLLALSIDHKYKTLDCNKAKN